MLRRSLLCILSLYLCLSIGQMVTAQEGTEDLGACAGTPGCQEPTTPKPKKYCEGGIKLNTNFPFIGDCIQLSSKQDDPPITQIGGDNATVSIIREDSIFPVLLSALSKIVMSLILVGSLFTIIYAGVIAISGDRDTARGKVKVVIGVIAALGMASVILKVVNPNFFGD